MSSPRNVKKAKRPVICEKCGQAYQRILKSDIFCPDCKVSQPQYSINKTCQRCGEAYEAWSKFRTGTNYCKACADEIRLVNISLVMDKATAVHNAPEMRNGFRKGKSLVFIASH